MKFLVLLIFAFLLYSNFKNFIRISKKQPRFEKLDQCLDPFKKIIQRNGFVTYKSNSNSLENYYLTQFILPPIILDNNGQEDTILYIKDFHLFIRCTQCRYFLFILYTSLVKPICTIKIILYFRVTI